MIWLGGSLVRNVIAYDIFVPATELTIKTEYSEEIINYNIYLFATSSIYTNTAFTLSFLIVLIVAISEKSTLKKEGWLFMSIILYLLVSPIVFYNIYDDLNLSFAVLWNDFSYINNQTLRDYFFNRFSNTTMSVLSGISYLAVLNIIAYAIYRPLQFREKSINEI